MVPLVKQYAGNSARFQVTRVINEAATSALADMQLQYDSLVKIERDAAGGVTSVEADVGVINRLKAALSLEITDRADEISRITASIPLGTFFGSRLLAGRGPIVKIPVSANVGVLTDFDSALVAAGINQTAHRIILRVKTTVFLAIPTAYSNVEIESSFIIAESVLIGRVPDAYTVVENIDEETVGEIFDYGAQLQN